MPFAYNGFRPAAGFLPDDFPYVRTKIIPLDQMRKVALYAPGIEIPMRPFFGSMGVGTAGYERQNIKRSTVADCQAGRSAS